ncbi:TPA: antirestriction protein [Escherichia coli]|nr:antirestriction protein [Escherichia coli]HAY0585889.1 antirestriction protein [Escherichia coli]HBB0653622.1 antirestriction protein [Escherichia coli]
MPSRAIKDFAYIVIFLSRQTTRRQQPSRYGQRGQGVNGGSVKIWTGVWVKQAGCCYSTVVVTQWNTDVKNSQWASGYIVAARQQPILLVCRILARQSCSTPANRAEMSPEAAGIAACLMTYSHHACRTENYAMTVHYYRLRDYALQHPECSAIMRIID